MIMRKNLYKTANTRHGLMLALLLSALGSGTAYAANPTKGSEIYAAQCATCHGATGNSVMPGAPSFANGESLMQPDTLLLSTIKAGKNAMPAYRGILSDSDILDVIAYLRSLR